MKWKVLVGESLAESKETDGDQLEKQRNVFTGRRLDSHKEDLNKN